MDARHILTIGIAYEPVRGGVAAVENVYSTFYKPFNHIATVGSGDDSKARKLLAFVKAYFKFWWWMLRHKEIKVVHVHGSSGPSFWRKRFFIRMAKRFGKKVVFHCHGGNFPQFTARHRKAVTEIIEQCDCIVALSEWWKQWFEQTFRCKEVVVIKNVIPQPHIHKTPHEGFNLLLLGLLGKNKGVYDLLDILTEHKQEFQGKIQVLLGGNGEVEMVQGMIKERGLENLAKYEGWVSGDKKAQLLNCADTYVLPSYFEGVPISILEAESYGLPVISTRVGGIPEIVEDGVNGILITPGDKDALYRAINKLMGDKTLAQQMGAKSLAIAEEHLPNHVEKQLSDMYTKLIGGKPVTVLSPLSLTQRKAA